MLRLLFILLYLTLLFPFIAHDLRILAALRLNKEGARHVKQSQVTDGAPSKQQGIKHLLAVAQAELLFVDRVAHADFHQHHRAFIASASSTYTNITIQR